MTNPLVIPSFSTPQTRADFTNIQNMLIAFFQNYGFSLADATSDAGTVINLQGQGYSLTDIATIILGYHQTLTNIASSNAIAAAASTTASEPKMQANAAIASTMPAQTPVTPAKAPVTITVNSSPSSGFWNVTIFYNDGTSVGYELSTANVNANIALGAKLIDNTKGLWTSAQNPNTSQPSTSSPTAGNVSLTLVFYNKSGQVQNNFTITNVVTAADYASIKSALAAAYGSRVAIQNVTSTNSPITINASALSEQADITISLIDQTPINNPTTEGGTLNGANVTKPVQFNIILPSGASQNNVILSASDYIQLQNNVGIFTISNANQGNYTPNTTYSQLLTWMNGGTPLASTQNGKTTNTASTVQDLTKAPATISATAAPTITKIILTGGSGGFWGATLVYSDNSQKSYSLSTANVLNDLKSSGAQLVDNTNGAWAAATGSGTSPTPTTVPAYTPSTSDVKLEFLSIEISGNSINFDVGESDVNPQAIGQKGTLVVTLDNNQSQVFAVTVAQAGGSGGQFTNVGVGSHTLSAILLLGSQQTGVPMSNVATSQAQVVAPSSSTPTPTPVATPAPANNPLQDALTSVENDVGTFISTAETNVNALISKVTGGATAAATAASGAAGAAATALVNGAGAASNAITQAAHGAGQTITDIITPTPTITPEPTPAAKTVTQITLTSSLPNGFWGVVLLYSDGSTQGYSLSTANVQSYISAGAALVDKTGGLWADASGTSATPPPSGNTMSMLLQTAKKYTLPIILAISAASGIFVAYEMSHKRGIVQHV